MSQLQVLCVARHWYIAEHFARFVRDVGIDATPAVGLRGAISAAGTLHPEVVICEYDLLATLPLDEWEHDAVLGHIPVVAMSLTRRANEMYPLDVNGISAFLYLPLLSVADAHRILYAAATRALHPAPPSACTTPSDTNEASSR